MRHRRRLLILFGVALLALALAPVALAGAGGGSAGFSGGGGGGGGGRGFALYVLIQLLVRIALIGHGLGALALLGLVVAWVLLTRVMPRAQAAHATRTASRAGGHPRRASQRERRVEAAAAVAAEEDPAFAADEVRSAARRLFADVEAAWDRGDRRTLSRLVAPTLMAEWERRLDDFERRGWHNHVQPLGEPIVEYVGLQHTGDREQDRVVVRIDARMRDYVVDAFGRQLKRTDSLSEITHLREFWTLQRRNGSWVLASIEQGGEGRHALDERIVATAADDEQALRDEALIEGAVADAVPDTVSIAEVADLQFEGDARSAANDLSLADGRFAPAVLEVAARRAVDAWGRAIDGDDTALRRIAAPQVASVLRYGADPSGLTRIVVRGPHINRIRIVGLDAAAQPPTLTVEVDITARRYVEDRHTTAVLAGSRSRPTSFTERWTLSLTGDGAQPWRLTAVAAPAGLA